MISNFTDEEFAALVPAVQHVGIVHRLDLVLPHLPASISPSFHHKLFLLNGDELASVLSAVQASTLCSHNEHADPRK